MGQKLMTSPEVYRELGLRPTTLRYWSRQAKAKPHDVVILRGKATNRWTRRAVEAIRQLLAKRQTERDEKERQIKARLEQAKAK